MNSQCVDGMAMSGQTDSQVVASLMQVAKGHFSAPVPRKTIATFISDYEFEIEHEYDFRISKQLRFQRSRSSLLLTSRKGYYGNDIVGTDHDL